MKKRSPSSQSGRIALCILSLIVVFLSGCRDESTPSDVRIASTNTYLQSVAMDLLGKDESVLPLAGPGTCPGHFDIAPDQVRRLRECRVLLRFHFQDYLERKLKNVASDNLVIVPIDVTGGLCVPDTYMKASRQTADALQRAGLLTESEANQRIAKIERRLNETREELKTEMQEHKFTRAAVLSSNHQVKFCKWLGLDVIGTFTTADDPAAIQRALTAGRAKPLRAIVGNIPQGKAIPNRLAKSLETRTVMFNNFPNGSKGGFEQMITENVRRLVGAAAP